MKKLLILLSLIPCFVKAQSRYYKFNITKVDTNDVYRYSDSLLLPTSGGPYVDKFLILDKDTFQEGSEFYAMKMWVVEDYIKRHPIKYLKP